MTLQTPSTMPGSGTLALCKLHCKKASSIIDTSVVLLVQESKSSQQKFAVEL